MDIAKVVAPTGHLRAAINLGNPVLAQKASGFVAKALAASGQADATVAPASK